ncbi:MAG: hypothetical protein ACEQSB_06375 [Undibacterium sp.]
MTDQAKIAALAAELERLGKNPDYGDCNSPKGLCPISDKLILAALSGAAAEVISDEWSLSKEGDNWVARNWMYGIRKEPTYHEALIAALKQIESEVKNA